MSSKKLGMGTDRGRRTAFVNKLVFSFSGNVNSNAVALADVDNDGDNELIVASLTGVLSIYKGYLPVNTPWRTCENIGTITCLTVGDCLGLNKNVLVVATAEGVCRIFIPCSSPSGTGADDSSLLIPAFSQRMPSSICCVLIDKLDDTSEKYVIIGTNNRMVHVYRVSKEFDINDTGSKSPPFEEVRIWSVSGQIRSLSTRYSNDGKRILLVGMQTTGYAEICFTTGAFSEVPLEAGTGASQIETGLTTPSGGQGKVAVSSLDGFVSLRSSDMISEVWQRDLQCEVLATYRMPTSLTDERHKLEAGGDLIVVCAWDGTVHVLDQEAQMCMFTFYARVSAFAAGFISIEPGKNTSCFVLCGFTDEVVLYFDVLEEINSIGIRTLTSVVNDNEVSSEKLDQNRIADLLYRHKQN